jgi:hypothetical protein
MIQQGDIELNPSYQRDVVWPEVKMIMLIQSLFLVRDYCDDFMSATVANGRTTTSLH